MLTPSEPLVQPGLDVIKRALLRVAELRPARLEAVVGALDRDELFVRGDRVIEDRFEWNQVDGAATPP